MIVLSKAEIVDRFSIGSAIYSKIPGSGFKVDSGEYDMNGVLFNGHWSYYTNNHFIMRCPVMDRPYYDNDVVYELGTDEEADPIKHIEQLNMEEMKQGRGQSLLFCGYNNVVESRTDSIVARNWINEIESCFMGIRLNSVIIEKSVLLAELDNIFGKKVNERASSAIVMTLDTENSVLRCKVTRFKKRDVNKEVSFAVPVTINNPFGFKIFDTINNPVIMINALYLSLLNVFEENEFITMSFNTLPSNPKERASIISERQLNPFYGMVVFKGYGGENPDIHIGISPIYPGFDPME